MDFAIAQHIGNNDGLEPRRGAAADQGGFLVMADNIQDAVKVWVPERVSAVLHRWIALAGIDPPPRIEVGTDELEVLRPCIQNDVVIGFDSLQLQISERA